MGVFTVSTMSIVKAYFVTIKVAASYRADRLPTYNDDGYHTVGVVSVVVLGYWLLSEADKVAVSVLLELIAGSALVVPMLAWASVFDPNPPVCPTARPAARETISGKR